MTERMLCDIVLPRLFLQPRPMFESMKEKRLIF